LLVKDQLSSANSHHFDTTLLHQTAIEQVIMAMRERLHEPLSLEDLAEIAHLNPYLYHFRVFHRQVGVPLGEFLAAPGCSKTATPDNINECNRDLY
jgi:YesN/AraC family two-component response regulator